MSHALVYSLGKCKEQTIDMLHFSLASNEEIERSAVVTISETTLYTKDTHKSEGLLDSSMGTMDRRINCATCGLNCTKCPGHTGVMHMPMPLYHMIYMEVIIKVLRSVCFFCNRIRAASIDDGKQDSGAVHLEPQHDRKTFLRQYNACRLKRTCVHCNGPCPEYSRVGNEIEIIWRPNTLFESEEEKMFCQLPFTRLTVDQILNCISDEDAAHLGFTPTLCHPRNFMLWVLLVPPPSVRPSVMTSEGSRKRGQDDITIKLQEINKRRNDLSSALRSSNISIPYLLENPATVLPTKVLLNLDRLQVDVALYMNNSLKLKKSVGIRGTTQLKSIMCKLKGKDGRIRGNLMGKRVNFCARTVITPDPNIDIDELGVPEQIILKLTKPERVDVLNIKALSECVRIGSNKIGGAATVITGDGSVFELEYSQSRENVNLKHGWVVERYLNNGDYVMFNRQPSLHRNSIMGHRVKIVKGQTFRLNVSCTSPYNADFDGDEMNLHVPQGPMAQAEVKHIMHVSKCIITPKSNKPCMGIVQDSLLGAYFMSLKDTFLTKRQTMQLVMCIKHPMHANASCSLPIPAISAPSELWTGKQVLSVLLPRITIGDPNICNDRVDGENIYIHNGVFIHGNFTKATLGASSGGVIHRLFLDFGHVITSNFMSDIQRVTNKWLLSYGFSVGIDDCLVNPDCERDMRENINNALEHVNSIVSEIPPGCGVSERLVDGAITDIVSKVTMQVGVHIKKIMNYENALMAMITAGSKGNPINLSQIMGCVGQNCVNGVRIAPSPIHGRVLPSYPHHDTSVNGRGFVTNSYLLGLEPDEYFFHAMGGREGLVDTAVKTAVTGYLQRRMIKAGESMHVGFDQSIRDANNNIVEFVYGCDGLDPIHLEKVNLSILSQSTIELKKGYISSHDGNLAENEFNMMMTARREVLVSRGFIQKDGHKSLDAFSTTVYLPFNVSVMLRSVKRVDGGTTELATRRDISIAIQEILQFILEKSPGGGETTAAVRLHTIHSLRSRITVEQYMLQVGELSDLLNHIKTRFQVARVACGEMVGCIAAQSIGEPCTQMTLNTFHLAGVGSSNVNVGIPRFKELIDLSKSPKTPSMKIALMQCEHETDESVMKYCHEVKCAHLKQHVASWHIEDQNNILALPLWKKHHSLFHDNPLNSPTGYCVCLNIDIVSATDCNITPAIIANSLENAYPNSIACIWSPSSSVVWSVYVFFTDLKALAENLKACLPCDGDSHTSLHAIGDKNKQSCSIIFTDILEKHIVMGILSVTEACLANRSTTSSFETPDGVTVCEKERFIQTLGSSLYGLQDYTWIDWYRTISNNVYEVYDVLGIEAAVSTLCQEIMNTISYDSTYVNHRHMMMIVNTMSYRGYLMPLSRHGINRADNGVLVRSSFEETGDVIKDAAMFGEKDNVQGVSQSIMLGQFANIGSGSFAAGQMKELSKLDSLVSSRGDTLYIVKSKMKQRRPPAKKAMYGVKLVASSYRHVEKRTNMARVDDDGKGNNREVLHDGLHSIDCELPYKDTTNEIEGFDSVDGSVAATHEAQHKQDSGFVPSSPIGVCVWK